MSSCQTSKAATACCASAVQQIGDDPLTWFESMIPHCLEYARAAHTQGRPIVGILCEYTPRELILAAGALPVCLCGGSQETIPAAEKSLPVNLCPLIKSTYGYHALKSNPFLEMADLVVAETTCDGKKKMYELMAETRPMYLLELPQKQNTLDGFAFWENELRKFQMELEHRFGIALADEKLREAIAAMNRERALRRDLAALMKRDTPPLTGRQLLQLKSSISGIPPVLERLEAALAHLRAAPVCGQTCKDRVRVLVTGVPIVHGAERIVDIVESHGGLVVCMENCSGLKPILEDVCTEDADPVHALAEKYFHLPCSIMTRNEARLESLRTLAVEYRVDCIVDLIWIACLTYDVESHYIKRLAEEELGVPYLRVETDYSPNDSARIAVRIEALMETARHRENGASVPPLGGLSSVESSALALQSHQR